MEYDSRRHCRLLRGGQSGGSLRSGNSIAEAVRDLAISGMKALLRCSEQWVTRPIVRHRSQFPIYSRMHKWPESEHLRLRGTFQRVRLTVPLRTLRRVLGAAA